MAKSGLSALHILYSKPKYKRRKIGAHIEPQKSRKFFQKMDWESRSKELQFQN